MQQQVSLGSWGTALSAAGMTAAVKKPPHKPGISVAKLSKKSTSASNLDTLSSSANSSSSSNNNSHNNSTNNLVALENLVPIDRNQNEKYVVPPAAPPGLTKSTAAAAAATSVTAPTHTKEKKIGNWVSIGGAPKDPSPDYSQVPVKLSDNEFPSLSGSSSSNAGVNNKTKKK